MPNFKQGGRGFKMKGFSPFTKKTDPPKTKAKYNANQTDERVFDVNQEKYNKWNRTMNRGKGPDVRYLGTEENNPHLENYLKWKKSGATPMKKDDKKAIRTLKDREGNVIKSDTINLVPITEREFFNEKERNERRRKKGTGAIIESPKSPKPPRQKNKKPKTGLEEYTGKGGLKLSPLKKDDDPKNQKKKAAKRGAEIGIEAALGSKGGFFKDLYKSSKQGLEAGAHEVTHSLSTQISSKGPKKNKTKKVPAIPRKSTQFNEANAGEKAILRQMNTIEGQLSKIKDKNSNRYKSLTSKHRDLDNKLWSYD
jgi:hypothetical protein